MNKYSKKRISKLEKEFIGISDRFTGVVSKIRNTLFKKWIPTSLNIGMGYLTGVPVGICSLTLEYVALTVKTYPNYEKFKVYRDVIYDYTKKEPTKRNPRVF